jgi:hypothetical protein
MRRFSPDLLPEHNYGILIVIDNHYPSYQGRFHRLPRAVPGSSVSWRSVPSPDRYLAARGASQCGCHAQSGHGPGLDVPHHRRRRVTVPIGLGQSDWRTFLKVGFSPTAVTAERLVRHLEASGFVLMPLFPDRIALAELGGLDDNTGDTLQRFHSADRSRPASDLLHSRSRSPRA